MELKGAIFNIGTGHTLLYNNTLDKTLLTYAGKNYTLCVRKSIEAMRDSSYKYIVQPTQTTPSSGSAITRVQHIIFKQKVKDHVKEKQHRKTKMAEIFNVIHEQCTKEFINQM